MRDSLALPDGHIENVFIFREDRPGEARHLPSLTFFAFTATEHVSFFFKFFYRLFMEGFFFQELYQEDPLPCFYLQTRHCRVNYVHITSKYVDRHLICRL